jgi:hypothetical protein
MLKSQPLKGEELVAYLEREVTPSEATAIETNLARSSEARRQLQQLEQIKRRLSTSPIEEVDLTARVRRAILSAQRPRPAAARARVWYGALAAAASLLLGIGFGSAWLPPEEFRSKAGAAAPALRWAGVQAYLVSEGAEPEQIGRRGIPRGAGLLLAYTNLGDAPYEYLMVFALDADRRVVWLYPGDDGARTEPESIRIEGNAAQTLLPDVVSHEWSPGPLAIHAIFSREPLRASVVERWLDEHQAGELAPPTGESVQQVLELEVEP